MGQRRVKRGRSRRDCLQPRNRSTLVGILAVVMMAAGCSGLNDAGPSPEAVLDMSCAELEQAWQSHRRGEWDAPGTFNLLVDEMQQEC